MYTLCSPFTERIERVGASRASSLLAVTIAADAVMPDLTSLSASVI
jgi:hypothetical protein